jgi:transposase
LPSLTSVAITTEKKSVTAAERNNRKRAWFWRKLKGVAHERLKFIDESGVTTVLTRPRGRAAPGQRVVEAVPKNYGQSTSVVSVLGIGGVETTMVIEGAVDTVVFDAFCQHFLRPCLQCGDVVVLDNLGAHRASRIEETVRECKAKVIWLPPYSPDFSPIESMWAKVKTYLRTIKARTTEDLERAVAEGMTQITQSDCRGWFKHCGYQVA